MHVTYSKGTYTVTASLADWRDLIVAAVDASGFVPILRTVSEVSEAERDNPDCSDVATENLTVIVTIQPEDWHSFVPHAVRLGLIGRGITADTLPICQSDWMHYAPACERSVRERGRDKARPENWRVNGQCRTWKRDASRFRQPVKHGLYAYGYVDDINGSQFHHAADCPYCL